MNRKKLLIAIVAIVLVVAVLLVIYFDYRSKHSMSLMGDEELQEYLEEAGAGFTLNCFSISGIRSIIRELEKDPDFFPQEYRAVNVLVLAYDEMREIVKDYYGISP